MKTYQDFIKEQTEILTGYAQLSAYRNWLKEQAALTEGILNEGGLARLHQHIEGSNLGIISAHRGVGNDYHVPEGEVDDPNEDQHEKYKRINAKNTAELEGAIQKAGFGYRRLHGSYVENYGSENQKPVAEHSFLVIGKKGDDSGKLKGFLTQHAQKYKQDSILFKPHNETRAHLYGTKENAFPGKDEKADVGEFRPDRLGEFYSTMNRGKVAFTFSPEQIHDTQETENIKKPSHRPIRFAKSLEKNIKVESVQVWTEEIPSTFSNTGVYSTYICEFPSNDN